ncbi:MAG: acetyl-CoA carboxylase, carboxyltransferase subunit beta [Candidatus Caenarcaniphilales bacterium]|nr:acetyl-CoA carboxylase, carboxyltransferase subunit beta [Candidatus Caenarcaniphilales bacterium]
MGLKDLFKFKRKKKEPSKANKEGISEEELSELWTQCPSCKSMIYNTDLKANLMVCTKCEYHFRINAYTRIEQLIDPDSWEEIASSVKTADPLEFSDLKAYSHSLQQARKKSETSEAIITGLGRIDHQPVALGVMEFAFLGGSMGSVVGERIARLCEAAIENKAPVILVSSSGGARMHEGLFSLMQMAKTSSSLATVRENKLLFISVLADPTYGGVSASFATLGDIIIAEPKAKIGFAGPRVIEETIRQKLPKDFQTSEYLLEHGQIDLVIHRKQLKQKLSTLVKMHTPALVKEVSLSSVL